MDWLATGLPYERFDPDLREAFTQRSTVSEITKPNAAQRIIEHRPYSDSYDLVRRHILLRAEYDRISGKVETR